MNGVARKLRFKGEYKESKQESYGSNSILYV